MGLFLGSLFCSIDLYVCFCANVMLVFCFFFGGTRASHCCGLSHCGAQAPDMQAQRPWLTGPAAPWHVGSSWTGARTCVPCIGRQTLNHCATREAPISDFILYQNTSPKPFSAFNAGPTTAMGMVAPAISSGMNPIGHFFIVYVKQLNEFLA